MRLFVSEYLCSGAWPDEFTNSLAREGRAMLTALLADASRIENVDVVTTWDARLGAPPTEVNARVVRSPGEERRLFADLVAANDATWLIAPEFDQILADRAAVVEAAGKSLYGPDTKAIRLCSDKLRLAEHLQSHDIPTLQTHAWPPGEDAMPESLPCVVKPRFGAGSQETFLIEDAARWDLFQNSGDGPLGFPERIIQPFVAGAAISMAAIVDTRRKGIEVFPAADQLLSDDGRLAYCGGRIPSSTPLPATLDDLIRRTCESIAGLRGYVGFDLVIPEAAAESAVVVEINPRLTTSYLGYRRLTDENLAERILFADQFRPPIHWNDGPVSFTVDTVADGLIVA